MYTNVGLYSYGFALLAYAVVAILLFLDRRKHPLAWPLFTAIALTAIWAGTIATSTLLRYPQIKLIHLAEFARNAAWIFLLLRLLGMRLQGSSHILAGNRWIPIFGIALGAMLAALFLTPYLASVLDLRPELHRNAAFAAWLAMATLGLLLLEQIYRNSNNGERWAIKHLCTGLGILLAYDFFMYAEALLFRQLDWTLWQARGFVAGIAAVFLAIAANRSTRAEHQQTVLLSRHVVFHSVTLLAAGIYLIAMALVGYFIQYLGGTWGGVLQVAFLCASGLLLLALLFSGQIRARTRVWLSKNFFSYKYDYRTEWLQFTRTLAEGGDNIPETIIRAIAHLTSSPGGLLWSRTVDGRYRLACHWQIPEPEGDAELAGLPAWLQRTEWIIDLHEWRQAPDLYEKLELPPFIADLPKAWLIIPLLFEERLQGILLLRESDLKPDINWEDRDLLKVAGRQAASHLAQYQASQALVEARQFEAFNRLSAYVVHDLKNILAQQSLIVSNAEKHRQNPAFIDDVLATIGNSVERMTRLMSQMREGVRGGETRPVELDKLLQTIVEDRQKYLPSPVLEQPLEELTVRADPGMLGTVFAHIIQNAQEASDRDATVSVRLKREADQAVVEVEDNGAGMEESFVSQRLFMPFDSTKGLAGMGIGAFESREIVRGLGGEIHVSSTPEEGSVFRIVLPCELPDSEEQMDNREAVSG